MATDRDVPAKTVAIQATEPLSFAAGRYVVRHLLGEGGQKTVLLAHDSLLDRDVAIALLKADGLDALGSARVQGEAQAMARLGAQPHIVTIFDMGEYEGKPFIVCEYMAGGDLQQAIQRADGHLSLGQTLQIAQDLCHALDIAHARGILHRDVKPANIWLTDGGHAKLGDFGLATALGRSRITEAGTIMGTAAYMAPEQALGGEVDGRSDLYSLGCVLYEMVTGRPPFLGDDTIAVVSQHINTAPVAPSWHQRNLPQALERLTLRLLAKSPEERPKSAAEVLAVLEGIAQGPQQAAPREEANPLDRLASGVFVGREQEFVVLRSALDEALSGHGRLVLLSGEPGIGKTRLAEELATYAQMRGAQVLWGRCYEGEGAPAYWPWVQAIRSYVYQREAETLLSELGTGAADIAQIVSEVRERLPALPDPPALEPEQARFRLFDSITTFLKNASRTQPLLLILDDLHWADRSSLLLLQFLAHELRDARIIVLGSYRDVELSRQHPLSHTLAELAREQLSQRIALHGLSEQHVASFIEMTAGIEPSTELVTTIYQETEGNPFFVKEVVSLLASEHRLDPANPVSSRDVPIPQSVREVVGRRLERLSEACDHALTVASVIGREFSLDVLELVTGTTGDALLDLLEEALAARVVEEVPRTVGRYSFAHALIRETLYDELTTIRRVRLHRQIGEALEQVHAGKPEQHLAELAYHFAEAARGGDDVDKAIDYAFRAGEWAMSKPAFEEAASHYLRAADIARERGLAEDIARAALGFSACVSRGPSTTKPTTFGVDESVVGLLEEALDAIGAADSALRAKLLASLAHQLYYSEGADAQQRRTRLSQEAIEVARRVGDPSTLAAALRSRRDALRGLQQIEKRLADSAEMLSLAEEGADKAAALPAHYNRLIDLLELGEIPALSAEIEAITRLAEELRQPRYLWYCEVVRATLALLQGRFEEGERLAQQALAAGQQAHESDAVITFGVQMFLLRREQGRLTELEALFKDFAHQYPTIPGLRCGLVYLYREEGRVEEARIEFERLADHDFVDLPDDEFRSISLTLLAEVCALLGDTRRAAFLYQLLLPYGARNVGINRTACAGSASRSLGVLAATMRRWKEAAQHFESALEMNARMAARPWLAETQRNYGEMLLARGRSRDQARAQALLAQAYETAQELGMKRLTERISALRYDCIAESETATRLGPDTPSAPHTDHQRVRGRTR